MTTTQIRAALTALHDAVDVPPVDDLAFGSRVRQARRRRTSGWVAAGAAAAAVVAMVGTGVAALDAPDRGSDPATPPVDTVGPSAPVPVALNGRLALVDDGGSVRTSEVRVEEVVGATAAGVLVVDRQSQVLLVPLAADGSFEEPQDVLGAPVQRVVLDKAGLVMGFVDLDDTLHLREVGSDTDVLTAPVAADDRLMAVDDNAFVIMGADGLVYQDAEGPHQLRFEDPPTALHQVEIGDGVVAVRVDDQLVFFSPDGRQTEERSGGALLGALAPDGHAYAQLSLEPTEVLLIDPRSADGEPIEGPTGNVSDLGWAPDGDLLVVAQDSGTRTLWRCGPDGTGCSVQVEDPTGTLRLN